MSQGVRFGIHEEKTSKSGFILLYAYCHTQCFVQLLYNYEHLGDKLLLNNENTSSNECKVLSVIRNSGVTGQREAKIRIKKGEKI